MLKVIEERVVGALAHLIALLSVLMLVARVLQSTQFPAEAYYFLIPNAVLALVYAWRSRGVFGHVMQALSFHLWSLLLVGGQPWLWRSMREWGWLSDKWYMTAAGPYHLFAAWGMMALFLIVAALFAFTVTIEGMISAAYGKPFQYWLFGKTGTWITTLLAGRGATGKDGTVRA